MGLRHRAVKAVGLLVQFSSSVGPPPFRALSCQGKVMRIRNSAGARAKGHTRNSHVSCSFFCCSRVEEVSHWTQTEISYKGSCGFASLALMTALLAQKQFSLQQSDCYSLPSQADACSATNHTQL